MNFFRRDELDDDADARLRRYDTALRHLVGPKFPWPIRMRDWELLRVLAALETEPPESRILEIGSYNTYLSAYLALDHRSVVASDLLARRRRKSLLRRWGLAGAKPTEAPYHAWARVVARTGARICDYDVTRLPCEDGAFDCIIAISVLEHVEPIERAVAELYRVLAYGGRLLLTIDCAPRPVPYARGVRYFSPAELEELFAPYPVTSPCAPPDFSPVNWCYGGAQPVLPAFVEVTKPSLARAHARNPFPLPESTAAPNARASCLGDSSSAG